MVWSGRQRYWGWQLHILIGLAAFVGLVIFWLYRANDTVKTAKELNYETKGLQRRAKRALGNLFGSKLSRVRDPRLAATILMIQLVRTGAPVMAAEKTAILDQMTNGLRVENPQLLFENAWGYTENRAFFSLVSDELMPLLRDRLTYEERLQLVEMLQSVADAYNGAGELQQSSINRLKKRLIEM